MGLPALPVVAWPDSPRQEELDSRAGLHRKTRSLVAHAGGRPFVWVDDEITEADRRWVAGRHPGPALLHGVDPVRGLREDDLATIRVTIRW